MSENTKPLQNQLLELPFKAILIRCLDENKNLICNASGFIRFENGQHFLYTCWHVVTGYDRNDLKVGNRLPNRSFLEVNMQDAQERQPGVTAIGGLQSFVIPLYNTSVEPKVPLWHQDKQHIPHLDLNAINIFVPFWHDVIKIAIPNHTRTSETQVIDETMLWDWMITVGDKLFVVGFPYGYSTSGEQQPTPVVLTRFVAATSVAGRSQVVLLESIGAPAMSGGPVFIERESNIYLIGLYTGLIYPDYKHKSNEMTTALGTCSNMSLCLRGSLPLVLHTNES